MARGGRRDATPGTAYTNRTDLAEHAPKVNFDGGYGDDKASASMQPARRAPSPAIVPRRVTSLDAPDDRPDEPVTSGLSIGAGPGPEVLTRSPGFLSPVDKLKALYAATGDPDVLDLLLLAERRR